MFLDDAHVSVCVGFDGGRQSGICCRGGGVGACCHGRHEVFEECLIGCRDAERSDLVPLVKSVVELLCSC